MPVGLKLTKPHADKKHRIHPWIDTKSLEPLFGIQENVSYGEWAHVYDDKQLLIFSTKTEAQARIKQIEASTSPLRSGG